MRLFCPTQIRRHPQLGRRLANPRTLASFGLAIILLVLAVRGLHIDPATVWSTMRHADLKFFVLAFLRVLCLVPCPWFAMASLDE